MNKVFYLILISLFSLTIISCAKKDDSSSISNSTDNSSVTLNISSFVIDTTLAAGTITGGVLSQNNDSDLSGVSVSFEKSGTTVDTTTTDSSGDFSQILTLGTYTITYSKSGYLDEIQSVTLAADNQTLVASTLKMLPDSCTSGTISGTIKDAVNNNPVTGVSLSVRRGVNVTTGMIAKSDTTSNTGTYSLSSMSAGWYTVETSKSGYITSTFNVYACGDISGQNTSISTTLDAGAMRIVLSWKTSDDLDAHLTGPDNLSGQGHYNAAHGQFHLYYPSSYRNFYYATNNFSCSGCSDSQLSDNVTLDLDSPSAIGSDGGPETITIGAVRSGTYRYYVQNFSQKGTNNTNLADADTYVKAYCNDNGTTTVTTYNVPNTAGDLWTVFGFNKCSLTLLNEMGSEGSFTVDVFAPKIAEVTAVTTPTGDTTPDYTFSSNEAGTIAYGGSCSSSTTSANADNNTITFNTLSGGTYSNCTITVTDSANNTSDSLSVSSFILDTTAPSLSEVTAVSTPTNDNTSSYTFSSNEAGTITYGGSCSSSTTAASVGDNTITFNELAENTYSNCTISVTDNVSNTSIALSVTSFTIDTTAPTLSRVTAVSSPINDSTPNYTFSSSEAGTITYGGSCSSSTTAASATSNTITLNALADGPYSNCTVSVTDSAGNVSSPHSINTFTVAVPPTLAEVTAVSNPTKVSTPNYTFSSSEAGTIAYAGNCSSSTTSATATSNTISFNALADGTHDNCTITVTDNNSNTSDNLSVTSFTVGAITPALAEVTVVTNLTNDNTPNYTFFSTLSGAITYGGSCSSTTSSAQENNNVITFNTLADNTYDNCTVMVTNGGRESDNLSVSSFTIDTIRPSLSQVTAVTTPTGDNTPDYTFSSSEAGTITYGGSCSSSTTTATASNNTITFNALSGAGVTGTTYSDCRLTVTDNASNASIALDVNSFTIDTTAPTLAQVTPVTTPTNDNTSLSYTFSSNEAGTITYGGSCSSTDNTSVASNNEITFNALSDDTYTDCRITVTDNVSNASNPLLVSSFKIDTIAPTLAEVTAVTSPTNDTTPDYIFSSNEAGTITVGGACNSSNTNASASNNTITFGTTSALVDNTSYGNCTIRVTDTANNPSSTLTVTSFTIDTTPPTVDSTSPTDNESSVSVSENISVTFSESMGTASVTTNTSNTSCSGSLQLSSDSFSSCVQMASSPSSSDNLTFTVTSSPKMFYSTTYKIRVTTAAKDSAGNNIAQSTQTYGFKTSVTFPMTAGSAHSCFMLDNGSVKCWGKNNLGQLGLGNTSNRGDNSSEMGDNLPVVDLGTGRTAKAIAAGSDHTCAILDNASIKCWGKNDQGQLGLGDVNNRGDAGSEMGESLPAVDLGSSRTAKAIAAGGSHTCAILDNASIKCWGKNDQGQLGLGDSNNRGDGLGEMGDSLPAVDLGSSRAAKAIAAGGSHTCAILDNSAIKCWGGNVSGQLGLGDTNNRGDAGSEMGDDLDTVDLGSGRTAVSITAGYGHTCALLDDNSVKCWGRQDEGQLGSKKTFNSGATSGKMGDVLLAVDLGSGRTSTAIAAGGYHSCAMLDNSSIKCWGKNSSGQLGLGHIEDRGRDQTGDSPCLENLMGDCLQSIEVGTGRTTRGIIAGDNQTCAILDNASIKCWGSNNAGQLGLGNTNNLGDNSSEMGDNLPVISL